MALPLARVEGGSRKVDFFNLLAFSLFRRYSSLTSNAYEDRCMITKCCEQQGASKVNRLDSIRWVIPIGYLGWQRSFAEYTHTRKHDKTWPADDHRRNPIQRGSRFWMRWIFDSTSLVVPGGPKASDKLSAITFNQNTMGRNTGWNPCGIHAMLIRHYYYAVM